MKIRLLTSAIYIELLKIIHSIVFWIIFAGFSIAPIIATIFVMIVRDPSISENSPLLEAKANLAGLSADWTGYLGFLNMTLGIGGIIVFGFITSWVFGREYADKTIKDLLTLPISRGLIITAKFFVICVWSLIVSLWIFLLGSFLGWLIELDGWNIVSYMIHFTKFCYIWLLVTIVGFPVAWFATIGKGYMAPLGFVFFSMAAGQIMGALGFGEYSPWAIPGLYSGAGGEEKSHINFFGFFLVFVMGFLGAIATWLQWKNADN
ncbi:MAG: ABC transporter permease [Spirochaetia bacterium]|nr:ABC transporter permease [Spirochaetia bacterium]